MAQRKYPTQLFVVGFIMNVLLRFIWLFLPSVILMIIGIFVRPCLYVGLGVLAVDVIVSLIAQIRICSAYLSESDNPDFQAFQEALSNDGSWKDNVMEFVNGRIADPDNQVTENNTNQDE